jgi:hypothetical protein
VFINYVRAKFRLLNSSVSLATAVKWKSKHVYRATAVLFYSLQKNALGDSFELHLLAGDFRILA